MTPSDPFKHRLTFGLGLLALASWYWVLAYFGHLLHTSPRAPIQISGHIYQMNNHGDVFYVTLSEWLTFFGGLGFPFAVLAIGHAIEGANHPKPILRPWLFWLNFLATFALFTYLWWPLGRP